MSIIADKRRWVLCVSWIENQIFTMSAPVDLAYTFRNLLATKLATTSVQGNNIRARNTPICRSNVIELTFSGGSVLQRNLLVATKWIYAFRERNMLMNIWSCSHLHLHGNNEVGSLHLTRKPCSSRRCVEASWLHCVHCWLSRSSQDQVQAQHYTSSYRWPRCFTWRPGIHAKIEAPTHGKRYYFP
jgi:hypothetical protein